MLRIGCSAGRAEKICPAGAWTESGAVGSSPNEDGVFTRGRKGKPMTIETAAGQVRGWLNQPGANLVEMHPEDIEKALDLLCRAGAGGKHLQTPSFQEVSWKNPLME